LKCNQQLMKSKSVLIIGLFWAFQDSAASEPLKNPPHPFGERQEWERNLTGAYHS